ncbi:MAG: hypothetical protein IKV96_04810 [Firmicutes bacterium]|nr:hypothetical protein [Bacillota bacterium]
MYFEEFEMDMEWQLGEVEIDREEALAFNHKYDIARVHIDEDYAKTTKFGDILPQGTMTAMLLWKQWLQYKAQGDEFIAGTCCRMEWYAPVMSGDKLHGRAYVVEKEDRGPKNGRVCVRIDGYNQNGKHVLSSFNHIIQKRKIAEK